MGDFTLPCGRMTLVDLSDLHLLAGRNWYSDVRKNNVYVRGKRPGQRRGFVYLHNVIVGASGVDHINGNGLDNRRDNLRVCLHSENCLNTKKKRDHKRFKGVYFDARRSRWWAQLYVNGRAFFGGYHSTEVGAAAAYDALAIEHHGEFARLNLK